MVTIKSHTDLSQSMILSKILPLESADMCWQKIYDENHMMSDYRVELIPYRLYSGIGVPCWSLAALLSVVPEVSLNSFKDGNWNAMVNQNGKMIYGDTGDPIDACYELILKLHELKKL